MPGRCRSTQSVVTVHSDIDVERVLLDHHSISLQVYVGRGGGSVLGGGGGGKVK